jgi:hypothetical protein
LFEEILAIADEVPDEAWANVPADLSVKHRRRG